MTLKPGDIITDEEMAKEGQPLIENNIEATPEPTLAKGDIVPDEEIARHTQTAYAEDKDALYRYPAELDEDELNYAAQTEIYGKDKNKFFMGVETAIDAAVDLPVDFAKGFAAFFPATAGRTLGGSLLMAGELAEDPKPMPSDVTQVIAGMPMAAIFKAVQSVAAKNTTIDEDLAQDGRDIIAASNEFLNNKFFQPSDTTGSGVAFDLGGAAGSLLTSLGLLALTKGEAAPAILFGQIAASDTYVRGREAGKSPRDSYQAALHNFATEGGFEYVGLKIFVKHLAGRKVFQRWLEKAGSEFFQEAGQTLGSELSAKTGGFGEESWLKIGKDMLYSGFIGFVMGGVGGAAQVARENRSVIGKMRELGVTDAQIEEFTGVMAEKHAKDFKAMYRKMALKELEELKDSMGKESPDGVSNIVVDELGVPVTLGTTELTEEEKAKYVDKDVIGYELADKYAREALGEDSTATETPSPETRKTDDPAVQARINQVEEELTAAYVALEPLGRKMEEGTLTKKEAKQYHKLQKEVGRLEIERDEVGFDFSGETIEEAPVEGGKKVRLKARELYKQAARAVREQLYQFKVGFQAGKDITKADVKAFQQKLIDLITMSDALTERQRERMLKTVNKTQTEASTKKRIAQLELRIQELEVANGIKIYNNAIRRILKRAQKKKFDASTRKVFDELIKLDKEEGLDPEKFREKYDGTMASKLRYDIALHNSINPSLQELRQVFEDLKFVYEQGVDAREIERRDKAEQLEKDRAKVNEDISAGGVKAKFEKNKDIIPRGRILNIGQLMWRTVVNRITRGTGKKEGATFTEKRLNTFKAFRMMNKVKTVYRWLIKDEYMRIFNCKDYVDVANKQAEDMVDAHVINYTYGEKEETIDSITGEVTQEASEGENISVTLTRAEMRKRVMEWQRGVGRKTLRRKDKYNQELMDKIENILSPADFAFIQFQFKMYDDVYQMANPIYRKIQGEDLPYDDFYSHLFTYGSDQVGTEAADKLLDGDAVGLFGNGIAQKSELKRATGGSEGLKQVADIFALQKYLDDMAHFIGYAELATDVQNLILNKDTQANIETNYGKGTVRFFQHEFDRMSRGRPKAQRNPGLEWIDNVTKPTTRTFLSNPLIGTKQLVSQFAYGAEVPPVHFVRYYAEFLNPVSWANGTNMKTFNKLRGSIMMQGRGDTFEREIKTQVDAINSVKDFLGVDERYKFTHFMLGGMRMGDRGAIYLGGYAMYRYDTEVKKMSHEQALEHFESFTNSTQQSPDPFELSMTLASQNPVVHLMTVFTQFPTQLFNAEMRAIANWRTVPKTETARKLFVYHILLPQLWTLTLNRFKWDNVDNLAALILGPFDALYIVGDVMQNAIRFLAAKALREKAPNMKIGGDIVESVAKSMFDLMEAVPKVFKQGGPSLKTSLEIINDLAIATAPVTGAAGGLLRYGTGVVEGARRAAREDYLNAFWKWMGYSNYAVTK